MGNHQGQQKNRKDVNLDIPKIGIFSYWNKLDNNIQTMIIKCLNFLELTQSRMVNKKWKMLIDNYINIMPSYRIYYELINTKYIKPTLRECGYTASVPTELLLDYCFENFSESLSKDLFSTWNIPINIYTLLSQRDKLSKFIRENKNTIESISYGKDLKFYKYLLHILIELEKRFTKQFIYERIKLFNRIYNTKIDPEAVPFRIIDEIRICDNDKLCRINIKYSTNWNRVDFGIDPSQGSQFDGSEGFSEEELSDENGNSKWHIPVLHNYDETRNLANEWENFDTEEIVNDWDKQFNEWDILIEHPKKLLESLESRTSTLVSEEYKPIVFALSCTGYIFRYIIFKTQKFLDLHQRHWTTFTYLPYDIDKLCKTKKHLHLYSYHLLNSIPLRK